MDVKYEHVHVIHDIGDINAMIIKKEKKKREPHKLVMINEEELIKQVENRPVLYDKSLKGYRKTALRDQCWKDIATELHSTVEECRKRWRSLRDAFAKHYKHYNATLNSKRKKWIFFDQMYFIAQYLDCAGGSIQETSHISQLQEDEEDNSRDGSLILNGDEDPEENLDNVDGHDGDNDADYKVMTTNNISTSLTTTNEIQKFKTSNADVVETVGIHDAVSIAAAISQQSQHIHTHSHNNHHQIHSSHHNQQQSSAATHHSIDTIDLNDTNHFVARIFTNVTDNNEYENPAISRSSSIENTNNISPTTNIPTSIISNDVLATEKKLTTSSSLSSISSTVALINTVSSQNENCNDYTITPVSTKDATTQFSSVPMESMQHIVITDPDERFLLSYAPILRRLSTKKNALARLRIQQILYNIEFGDLS